MEYKEIYIYSYGIPEIRTGVTKIFLKDDYCLTMVIKSTM